MECNTAPVAWATRLLLVTHLNWQIERHRLGLSGDDSVIGINQFDTHFVLADRQACNVDRIAIAGIRPPLR